MKIVKPYVKILKPETEEEWSAMLTNMEYCTRISHRSEEDLRIKSPQDFLRFNVMKHGDFSVTEHSVVTVEMLVDRGIQQELTRHRLPAYTIESTRFVNYAKKMPPSFIYPQVGVECMHCLDGDTPRDYWDSPAGVAPVRYWYHSIHHGLETHDYDCAYNGHWLSAIDSAENEYKALLRDGWKPQDARSVFPLCLSSKIAVTSNLRNWRHILNMRTSAETHPSFRQVSIPLLELFKANQFFGWMFEDIIPGGKQSEMQRNMR